MRNLLNSAVAFMVAGGLAFTLPNPAKASEQMLRTEDEAHPPKPETRKEKTSLDTAQNHLPEKWYDRIHFSGKTEIEAFYSNSTKSDDESDISISAVELGIDADLAPWITSSLLILFEEDATEQLTIDEGTITIGNKDEFPLLLTIGRMYLPLGRSESWMITDPLTVEIGETRETVLQVSFTSDRVYGSAFIFNGDTKSDDNDHITGIGVNLGVSGTMIKSGIEYDLGISWLNNIADSDTIQDAVSSPENLNRNVAGLDIYASTQIKGWHISGEYLSALSAFKAADLAYNGRGAQPAAFMLEAGYEFDLLGKTAGIAVGWQKSSDAASLSVPKGRILASFSLAVFDNTLIVAEYSHNEDYNVNEGGSGSVSDNVTLQLSVEF